MNNKKIAVAHYTDIQCDKNSDHLKTTQECRENALFLLEHEFPSELYNNVLSDFDEWNAFYINASISVIDNKSCKNADNNQRYQNVAASTNFSSKEHAKPSESASTCNDKFQQKNSNFGVDKPIATSRTCSESVEYSMFSDTYSSRNFGQNDISDERSKVYAEGYSAVVDNINNANDSFIGSNFDCSEPASNKCAEIYSNAICNRIGRRDILAENINCESKINTASNFNDPLPISGSRPCSPWERMKKFVSYTRRKQGRRSRSEPRFILIGGGKVIVVHEERNKAEQIWSLNCLKTWKIKKSNGSMVLRFDDGYIDLEVRCDTQRQLLCNVIADNLPVAPLRTSSWNSRQEASRQNSHTALLHDTLFSTSKRHELYNLDGNHQSENKMARLTEKSPVECSRLHSDNGIREQMRLSPRFQIKMKHITSTDRLSEHTEYSDNSLALSSHASRLKYSHESRADLCNAPNIRAPSYTDLSCPEDNRDFPLQPYDKATYSENYARDTDKEVSNGNPYLKVRCRNADNEVSSFDGTDELREEMQQKTEVRDNADVCSTDFAFPESFSAQKLVPFIQGINSVPTLSKPASFISNSGISPPPSPGFLAQDKNFKFSKPATPDFVTNIILNCNPQNDDIDNRNTTIQDLPFTGLLNRSKICLTDDSENHKQDLDRSPTTEDVPVPRMSSRNMKRRTYLALVSQCSHGFHHTKTSNSDAFLEKTNENINKSSSRHDISGDHWINTKSNLKFDLSIDIDDDDDDDDDIDDDDYDDDGDVADNNDNDNEDNGDDTDEGSSYDGDYIRCDKANESSNILTEGWFLFNTQYDQSHVQRVVPRKMSLELHEQVELSSNSYQDRLSADSNLPNHQNRLETQIKLYDAFRTIINKDFPSDNESSFIGYIQSEILPALRVSHNKFSANHNLTNC